MNGMNTENVLRCEQCNKPFDKVSTLKRHAYYCRSRREGKSVRSRSCIACAKRKGRCDSGRPQCSRCTAKGIECHYPTNALKNTALGKRHNDVMSSDLAEGVPSTVINNPNVEHPQEASNARDRILNSTLGISISTNFASFEGDALDWGASEFNFPDFLTPQTNDEAIQNTSSASSYVLHSSTPIMNQRIQAQQASYYTTSIPASPTSVLRGLNRRTKLSTGAQRIGNLVFHTLKSYPLMMMRHNTLPPFIHPLLVSSEVENYHIEPLTNCINLVHMISNGNQGGRKLFWRNVRTECEHLFAEHASLSKWELLAAMQALSVYTLIRMDEGETEHNNFDSLLLAAVTVICQEFARSEINCDTEYTLRDYGLEISWRDWVFQESRRRLAVIYRVVNMLVYFEPATMCTLQSDLVLAPLPARKQLWEAGDEFAWKANSNRPGARTDFGLAASGELVKMSEGQLYCHGKALRYESLNSETSSSSTGSWEEWFSGIDGFGGLVMLLAASLAV